MIGPGSVVEALRDGGHDKKGQPVQRPVKGRRYMVLSTYEMRYGLGCTLVGLNPQPYLGYFLHVAHGPRNRLGWYFREVPPEELELEEAERSLRREHS